MGETLLTTPRFRVERIPRMQDGRPVGTREVVRHPGAVVILPWTADGELCLIRNRREAIEESLLELPAGTLEPGEDPAAAARRELQEETGYHGGRWEHLLDFFPSPGILDERMMLFVAEGLEAGLPRRELGEQITNEVHSWESALAQLRFGNIKDGKTLVGLLWWNFRRAG